MREQYSKKGARHGENEVFDNQQADNPRPRRAEGQAHRDFAASRHPAHQDQPRDVRARDQQDQQAHRANNDQGRQHLHRGAARCLPERHDSQPLRDIRERPIARSAVQSASVCAAAFASVVPGRR